MNRQRAVAAILLLLLLAAAVVLTHNSLTAPYPGLNDFMSRWEGARSYWIDGLNPYGEEASVNIQQRIYGRLAEADEDPGYFAYPMYMVLLVGPLVFMDYAWASAIWMVLLEACLIAALILALDFFHWKPRPWLLAILLLWTLVLYYAARGLILGQPGLLVYFLEILTLWGLARERDRLAGVALALSTIKPQMGFLLVPLLLLWALQARRWRFVLAFVIAFGLLFGLSFVMQPSWLGDWLAQVQVYSSYTALGSPVWIVTQYYLGLGTLGEWAVNLVFYGWMLWAWAGLLRGQGERFWWVVVLTLTVTHLVAPRTATPHYVVFILPLIFYFSRMKVRWVVLSLLALFLLPWLHFVTTVQGEFEHPTVYLPLPFLMAALLWWTRRLWWQYAPRLSAESS